MNRVNRRTLCSLSLIAVMGLLASVTSGSVVAQTPGPLPPDLQTAAISIAAGATGSPVAKMTVEASTTLQLPLTGKVAYAFKVADVEGKAVAVLALDTQGKQVDENRLLADEEAARVARYGKLDPALIEQMNASARSQTIPVIVWLKEAGYMPPARPTMQESREMTVEQLAAYSINVDDVRAAAVSRVVAPLASRLANLGYAVEVDKYTPVLYAALRAEAIKTVAGWAEVDQVYLNGTVKPMLDIVLPATGVNTVHNRRIMGFGTRIGQVEVGGRVATNNPNLYNIVQDATYVCAAANAHSTGVAGIMYSYNPTYFGVSPGAQLWAGGSCSGLDSEVQNRTTAAANWGASAINLSLGANRGLIPGSLDRFMDGFSINRARTVVVAAGNEGAGCNGNGNVTSPALGYNVISVGNFNDRNTVAWLTDTMNSCSSWRDPASTYGDREKPEVAGPGTLINSTTTTSPWTGNIGSGTSFAAPVVNGMAALLMNRQRFLQSWPETLKAVLMASSVHNVEGATRLSEYDGAGGVWAVYADDIARGAGGWMGGTAYNCSTATPLEVTQISLAAGTRTRVAIVWNTDPAYASYASRPSADLDLRVYGPTGAMVASSFSWDNTYEIVEFNPPSAGVYRVRVNRASCSLSPRFVGWAWKQG